MNLWWQKSKKPLYLDHAASTPAIPEAYEAYLAGAKLFGNPSSPHEAGRKAKELLEESRKRIARLAEVKTDAVIFTSGATEANALGIRGYIEALHTGGRAYEEMHVLYLPTAHSSLIGAITVLSKMGVVCEALALTEGNLNLPEITKQVKSDTVLIALDLVCGETGAIYPIRDIRRLLDAGKHMDVRILVDASQAPRVHSYSLTHLGADMVVLDAQKVGGVRGIGALIAPRAIPLSPLITGGPQERGVRPGTENPALASAFAVALEDAAKNRKDFIERSEVMRARLIEDLTRTITIVVFHETELQAPHILSMSLPERDTDYLVALLSDAGFYVSTKSACETNEPGSRVILLRTKNAELAASTLRVSWSPSTNAEELGSFSTALITAVNFIDKGIA